LRENVQDEHHAVIVFQNGQPVAAGSEAAQAEVAFEHRPVRRNVGAGEIYVIELHWTYLSYELERTRRKLITLSAGNSLNERKGHPDYQPGCGFCTSTNNIEASRAVVNRTP
jgi:hypothetical protein